MPKDQSSYIKVFGLGGGGGNAVNYMFNKGISGVNFYVCNTDAQAMNTNAVSNRIILGPKLTNGLGAGALPEVGRNAAIESLDEITQILQRNTKMLFIVAGMGKGTGTGSAPIVAKAARELGILTVAIVTTPFKFEGSRKMNLAQIGLDELKQYVDSLIIIENEKLKDLHPDLTFMNAYAKVDDVVADAVKSIAEIVTIPGYMNVDFNDVNTVMKDSGVAIMSTAAANGEERALKAIKSALASPLLRNKDIYGTKKILMNISTAVSDFQLTMEEVTTITDYLSRHIGDDPFIIWGNTFNDDLVDELRITLLATGFKGIDDIDYTVSKNVFVTQQAIRVTEEDDTILDLSSINDQGSLFDPRVVHQDIEAIATNTYELNIPIQNIHVEIQNIDDTETDKESVVDMTNVELVKDNTDEDGFMIKKKSDNPNEVNMLSKEVQEKRMNEERRRRMLKLSQRYDNLKTIIEMEKIPAITRNNTELDDFKYSNESLNSNYSIGEEEDTQGILKKNNGYIHPNID